MGRRAVHHTTQQRASANVEHTRKYRNSIHGRAVRVQGNRLRYTRKVSKSRISRLVIPQLIETWAELPLLTTARAYREALQDDYDDTDFKHWLSPPPFDVPEGEHVPAGAFRSGTYEEETICLEAAVDGRMRRQERAREEELRERYRQRGQKALVDELRGEVQLLLVEWKRLIECRNLYATDSRERAIWERHMNWLARHVCCLYYLTFLDE
ncbi:hypothetical protein GGX14DRAFT_558907 [Mycena pura]|uniref:Uncharacterized protein n=1 Tax=Mycena pura TaxID=153505 RepID=A0AAD6YI18_9AGAR|nr:hypothetical protein GGX14DRAFT_558907 [Mycena pura]